MHNNFFYGSKVSGKLGCFPNNFQKFNQRDSILNLFVSNTFWRDFFRKIEGDLIFIVKVEKRLIKRNSFKM